MKKHYLFIALISAIYSIQCATNPLDEITLAKPEIVVLLDEQTRTTCQALSDIWQEAGHRIENKHIKKLLNPKTVELDYETVLKALNAYIDELYNTYAPEEQKLRSCIQELYNQYADEYERLSSQLNTRRIKCKFFCKVTTRDLMVNNNAYITKLIVKDALTVNRLTGALIASNGNITTGQIPANAIPDDSITNDKLADNAVTTNKIAPMTITPDDTAFNPVVATVGEAKPLTIYRGSINADGTVLSGTGFSSIRAGVGPFVYTISLNAQPYTDANNYQVFAQTLSGNPLTVARLSGSQFSITITNDEEFSLFTIGA